MVTTYDACQMTTATTGTGTITLGSAVSGFQSFNGVVPNNVIISYGISDVAATWELGSGTYTNTASVLTLTRTPLWSSNAGGPINLSGGATVYVTVLAEDLNTLVVSNSISVGNSSANLQSNTTEFLVTNSSANSFLVPGQGNFGNSVANVLITGLVAQTSLINSTANTFITPGQGNFGNSTANVLITGLVAQTSLINSTANTFIMPGQGTFGNATANVTISGLTAKITLAGAGANQGLVVGTANVTGAGVNGYSYLTNGILMQWGVAAGVNTTAGSATFKVAFPTACIGVTASSQNVVWSVNAAGVMVINANSSVAVFRNGNTGSTVNVFYIAIGN